MIKKDDVLDYVRSRDFDVLEILGAETSMTSCRR